MSDPAPLVFEIRGMHCASCVSRVERELRAQPGVLEAFVSLPQQEARLVTDAAAEPEAIRAALAAVGYELTLVPQEGLQSDPAVRQREESAQQWRRFAGAAALALPVFVLGMSGVDAPWSRWTQALLATPVVFVFGAQFHVGAWRRLRHGGADMDTLISLGSLAAWSASLVPLARGGPVYFETAAVIVSLILLGRSFEARARGRASAAVSRLIALGARRARISADGSEREVPVEQLAPGDLLIVGPGERVAADSVVVEGRSTLDESMLTGEPTPVDKASGDPLFGATLNGGGRLLARVERVGRDSTLARIVRAVEDAQASKAPVQRLVDRVAAVFVPVVLAVSGLTFAGWWVLGAGSAAALENAVAVLVIACPCALGLATPTAVMVGSGRGAELGLLFRGAAVFERAHRIDTVVFDKTGTLTRGAMTLVGVVCDPDVDEDVFLARTAAIEAATGHPVGAAVARAAGERLLELAPVEDLQVVAGRGAHGRVDGVELAVGRPDWIEARGLALSPALRAAVAEQAANGLTAFAAGWDGRARGVLAVGDEPKPEAADAVRRLRAQGIDVVMITGDGRAAAAAVAADLGIDRVIAEALPEEKSEHVAQLQEDGRRVAFVGDGINDAPALARADLGIAMGGGTEVAIETGDVVLLSADPGGALLALALARRTYRVIAQNLFWAFAYNTAAIPIAASGLLDPMLAAGAMAFSSLSVVLNSLRLRRFRAPAR